MKKGYLVAVILVVSIVVLSTAMAVGIVFPPQSNHTIVQDVSKTLNKPANATLLKSVSDQGLTVELYMQPTIRVGDAVEIHLLVRNVANNANLIPTTGSITVTDQSGHKVYEAGFAKLHEGNLPIGGAWEATTLWDTSRGYSGLSLQPGTFTVQFNVNIDNADSQLKITLSSSAVVALSQ